MRIFKNKKETRGYCKIVFRIVKPFLKPQKHLDYETLFKVEI